MGLTAPTVSAAATRYLDHLAVERGLAGNTLDSYRRDLRRYAAVVGPDTPLDTLAEADVARFLSLLREGTDGHPPVKASSAARTLAAVRGLHRFGLAEGWVPTDVSREVRPPTLPRNLPKAITVDEVQSLLDAAVFDQTPLALRDGALLELLYATGARISEAVGLDVDDLDLEAGSVRLFGKGSRERVVPVGSFARKAVSAYLVRARPALATAGRGTSALFLNARGGRLSRQSAWTVLRDVAEKAGVRADVRVVQELLGHASVTTTQLYTLVTVDKLREVYAAAHPRATAAPSA